MTIDGAVEKDLLPSCFPVVPPVVLLLYSSSSSSSMWGCGGVRCQVSRDLQLYCAEHARLLGLQQAASAS